MATANPIPKTFGLAGESYAGNWALRQGQHVLWFGLLTNGRIRVVEYTNGQLLAAACLMKDQARERWALQRERGYEPVANV